MPEWTASLTCPCIDYSLFFPSLFFSPLPRVTPKITVIRGTFPQRFVVAR